MCNYFSCLKKKKTNYNAHMLLHITGYAVILKLYRFLKFLTKLKIKPIYQFPYFLGILLIIKVKIIQKYRTVVLYTVHYIKGMRANF